MCEPVQRPHNYQDEDDGDPNRYATAPRGRPAEACDFRRQCLGRGCRRCAPLRHCIFLARNLFCDPGIGQRLVPADNFRRSRPLVFAARNSQLSRLLRRFHQAQRPIRRPGRKHAALNASLRLDDLGRWRSNILGDHWCKKAISAARKGLNVQRGIGAVSQHSPDLLHAVVHPLLEVNVGFFSPKLLPDSLPTDDLTGVIRQ